ncbi:MAG: hypothetical protein KY467_00495 [Gemmatimonadetes bacterium]|nr:hypothetical protein [Gemmatimonadota bacterium]
MLDKAAFLAEYRISDEQFAESKLDWGELVAIHDEFLANRSEYLAVANFISERLQTLPGVHSIKLRVKDPAHLIEKIVRKRIADPTRDIGRDNYTTALTDLIGLRALHLFKDGWLPIHDAISGTWDLHEPPVANIRRGDPEELVEQFRSAGCEINEHEFGYRSIHYLVRSRPSKHEYIAEIQVRTIFEEGWSEIDHQIRYPYEMDNSILAQFLVVFNRLAGSADEMGSFVQRLKRDLHEREAAAASALSEKNALINTLQEQIEQLKVTRPEKEKLKRSVKDIERSISSPTTLSLLESAMGKFAEWSDGVQLGSIAASRLPPEARLMRADLPLTASGVAAAQAAAGVARLTMPQERLAPKPEKVPDEKRSGQSPSESSGDGNGE